MLFTIRPKKEKQAKSKTTTADFWKIAYSPFTALVREATLAETLVVWYIYPDLRLFFYHRCPNMQCELVSLYTHNSPFSKLCVINWTCHMWPPVTLWKQTGQQQHLRVWMLVEMKESSFFFFLMLKKLSVDLNVILIHSKFNLQHLKVCNKRCVCVWHRPPK